MSFPEVLKIGFYLILLIFAFIVLQLLNEFSATTPANISLLWEESFEIDSLNKQHWFYVKDHPIKVEEGSCRIEKSEFPIILNLPSIAFNIASDIDSGYLEIKAKLPVTSQARLLLLRSIKDTMEIKIPEGIHSTFIDLRSEGMPLKSLGGLHIEVEDKQPDFDLVNSTRRLMEEDVLLIDHIRIYGIIE